MPDLQNVFNPISNDKCLQQVENVENVFFNYYFLFVYVSEFRMITTKCMFDFNFNKNVQKVKWGHFLWNNMDYSVE